MRKFPCYTTPTVHSPQSTVHHTKLQHLSRTSPSRSIASAFETVRQSHYDTSMQLTAGHCAAFFPKADAAVLLSKHAAPALAERPTVTAPVLDPEHTQKPLDTLSAQDLEAVYPEKENDWAQAPVPSQTHCPSQCNADRYLFPALAQNERLRLTMVFYYTRGALEDEELMSRLQEKVLVAHETVGWDFVIAGLLNHNTYTRMVTVNLPLAVLPRRESTCAHTINQTPGTIFALPNMVNDWRFKHSPHVEIGGLRAYAGVPLKFETEFGQHVAFGSLCVASNSPQELLSKTVQQSLARLADWIVADIVHSARGRRQRERRRMLELLSHAQQQCDEHVDMEQAIPNMICQVYPYAQVTVNQVINGQLLLDCGTTFSTSRLEQGLWEDTTYFDHAIKTMNHLDMTAPRAVRVIAAQCTSQRAPTFLVVACNDLKMVFDDVDSWFVNASATILSQYWQGLALREALAAKEQFLRGITHQLRTPIHGILGSVELLTEELKMRHVILPTAASSSSASPSMEQLDPHTYIQTIKSSARDLISTVNSLIKLNQWAYIAQAERVLTLQNVSDIESALLKETLLGLPDDVSKRPSIIMIHHLPPNCNMLAVDMRVFLDCIQPLMVNAAQHSAGGVVAVSLSVTQGFQSFVIDVQHNGGDVATSHYKRMIDVNGKVDLSTAESALGLTIACKAAKLLGGQVTLATSDHGLGSHATATFNDPICASPFPRIRPIKDRLAHLPPKFYRITSESQTTSLGHYFGQYLLGAGWLGSKEVTGAFIIVDYTPNLAQLYNTTWGIGVKQVAICPVPENACFLDFQEERVRRQNNILYVQGPFKNDIIEQVLELADAILAEPRAPILELGSCSLESISATSTTLLVSPALSHRSKNLPRRASVFPEKLQSQLTQAVQSLHIQIASTVPSANTHKPTIQPMTLLVDDNAVNLRLLEMYCTRRNIPFRLASDGQQAVDIFHGALLHTHDPLLQQELDIKPFALILMDLQMPVCNGFEATRQIRQLEKEHGCDSCALFIVTGQDSPADRRGAEEAGADEFLVKPIGPKFLDTKRFGQLSSQLERDALAEKPGRVRLNDGLTASARQLKAKLVAAIPHIVIGPEKEKEYRQSVNAYWDQKACEVPPACIVRPRNVWELAQAVKILRREFDLRSDRAKTSGEEVEPIFAVRGGGHSPVPGASSIRGGVLIDLSLLDEVTPAEGGKSVVIGAGCIWINVYQALEKEGLAVVGGRNSAVGVSGLTLGGGLSFFSPRYGLVCNNIIEYQVVVADGSIATASEKENTNLWKALKGGGNNFGIVTRFTVRAFPSSRVMSGFLYLASSQASKVLALFHSFVSRTMSGEVNTRYDPDAAGPLACFTYLQSLRLQAIAVNLVHTSPTSKRSEWPDSWRSSGFARLWRFWNTCKVRSLSSATDELSVLNPPGSRQEFATTTIKNDEKTLEAAHAAYRDAIVKIKRASIKGMSWTLVLQPLLPSWTRKGDANPLGLDKGNNEDPMVIVSFTVNWVLSKDDVVVQTITRQAIEQIDTFALQAGTHHRYRYLNYCAAWQKPFEGYGHENLEFLRRVSREVDPEGLFQRGCQGGFKLGME
ncbi:histidine kinase HHK3p [Pyrenophora seminiperda CCB06]|uniref:Histidine kinase HHK3p n=1 Tax=Pyrenophora seminiperda CCB06 TaxID=1302712 RepID=A0A3M7MJ64_9PLEO|nr:histidine kinase HHK3p [Pyrenophora seminiperda CCB06]